MNFSTTISTKRWYRMDYDESNMRRMIPVRKEKEGRGRNRVNVQHITLSHGFA